MLGTVQRTGRMLDLFRHQAEWGVTAVATELSISKSQAHELLTSLCAIGLLRRSGRGRYRVGWRTVSLGGDLLRHEFRGEAERSVRRVTAACGETSHLVALDRASVVVLARCRGREDTQDSGLGDGTLHCTAAGKVLLAMEAPDVLETIVRDYGLPAFTERTIVDRAVLHEHLEGVRQRQLAVDLGESAPARRAVAVPILDAAGRPLAALTATSTAARWQQRERDCTTVLRGEAVRLSRWLRPRSEDVPSPRCTAVAA
ncbi:IclR family transcriptional regulator [Conexibacter sp. CPCC 206217]|uniref:IclR family transcriptional regulator n=1 Tax=Conexibacter sp. CPCC 206217 TaxID=3064574 RepID=UPI00271E9B52|nr:IclR family transcriptional regulator C-terminal domain-containing protein [Conexibacter sp. CPCC 206217]MDO8210138.1 IclR family transcriptional regulator C-terminal domain-containing protein [Conexibacter sp. CPCC 206217]